MRELVLTGLEELWPKQDDQSALYLGPWCFASNQQYTYSDQRRFELAKAPFNNMDEVVSAWSRIDSIIDRLYPGVAKALNAHHGVNCSISYWQKRVSPWLIHFAGICYDRYFRLKLTRFYLAPKEQFAVKLLSDSLPPIEDLSDFFAKMGQHYFNHVLMSDLIRVSDFDHINAEASKTSRPAKRAPDVFEPEWGPRTHVHLGGIYGLTALDKLFMHAMTEPLSLLRWQREWVPSIAEAKPFTQILEFEPRDDVERAIAAVLLRYLPRSLIMHRPRIDAMGSRVWIGNDIYRSEMHSDRIASVSECGGKWISSQHGGGYGQFRSFPLGKIEFQASDGFISWGWTDTQQYPVPIQPLPSPMLSKLPPYRPKSDRRHLTLVGTMHPTYFYRFHTTLLPEQILAYIEAKRTFFANLKPEILAEARYKSSLYDYGSNELKIVQTALPKEQCLKPGSSMRAEFERSRLVVIDHLATSAIEALSIRIPTLLFWNPEHFVVGPKVQPTFDALRSAGILFHSAEEAAKVANSIWHDVNGWWNDSKRQTAVDQFRAKYALSSLAWRREWIQFIRNEIRQTKATGRPKP